MSIFNKTTGIDFQEFGEIFNETTFKNQYVEGRFYLAIDKKETNKFYIGFSNNGADRIQGHFTHELTSTKKESYTYKEALKNKNIEIRVLCMCNSESEAKYKEKLMLKKYSKILNDKLLNKVI